MPPASTAANHLNIQIFRLRVESNLSVFLRISQSTVVIWWPKGPSSPQSVGSVVLASKHHRPQTECGENSQQRPPALPSWNSLPPAPLAGWALSEQGLSLADLDEYSISRSTGPDDGFFHINGLSHKYSNPKGRSSSSGSRWSGEERTGQEMQVVAVGVPQRRSESPSARALHLVSQLSCRPLHFILSWCKYLCRHALCGSANIFLLILQKENRDFI